MLILRGLTGKRFAVSVDCRKRSLALAEELKHAPAYDALRVDAQGGKIHTGHEFIAQFLIRYPNDSRERLQQA